MKQEITDAQKKTTENVEKLCQQCVEDKAKAEAEELQKKIKEAGDKIAQDLSQKMDDAIQKLQKAIDLLTKIVSGSPSPDDPEFNADAVIGQLQKLIDPVVGFIKSLPVPEVPGLSDVAKLMAQLAQAKSENTRDKELNIQPSPAIMNMLSSLLAAIQALCFTLPLTLINLIFQMVGKIVDMFKQIAGILGVPSIPFPLNLVPQCISMMPDITTFAVTAPMQISKVAYAKLKDMSAAMTSLQFPDPPASIESPQLGAECPKHSDSGDGASSADNA